jgi:hypothetical protein
LPFIHANTKLLSAPFTTNFRFYVSMQLGNFRVRFVTTLCSDLLQGCWGLRLLQCIHCLKNGSGLSENVKVLQLFICFAVFGVETMESLQIFMTKFVDQSMKRILVLDKFNLLRNAFYNITFYISKIDSYMSRVTACST